MPLTHVDFAKLRDDLEKQIISAASPQKQRELRLKLSRVSQALIAAVVSGTFGFLLFLLQA